MMTNLIVARHGNTFEPGEVPRRVGARTDLPLVAKGQAQARQLGAWLKDQGQIPDVILSGPLLRHTETAQIAGGILGLSFNIAPQLTEIDYGPDENKTEADVIARIGKQAIEDWNREAIVPPGWLVDQAVFRTAWRDISENHNGKTVLAITSNGTARFAVDLLRQKPHDTLKLGTGCIGWLRREADSWDLVAWNQQPQGRA